MDSRLLVGFITLYAASFAASQRCVCAREPGLDQLHYYPVSIRDQSFLASLVQSAMNFERIFVPTVMNVYPNTLICSPVSIWMALSMLTYGMAPQVSNEMYATLGFQAANSIRPAFQMFANRLNLHQGIDIQLVNKIYIPCNLTLQSEYRNTVVNDFRSQLEGLNFTDQYCASQTINNWYGEQSYNVINNIISPGELPPGESIVLGSALYFSGYWDKPFDPFRKTVKNFYVSKRNYLQLLFMNAYDIYNYGILPARFNATFVELQYQGATDHNGGASMIIILPYFLDGLGRIESNMNTILLEDLIGLGRPTNVALSVPPMNFETVFDENDFLRVMGVNGIFNPASVTGISLEPLSVSKIFHKAVLKVNEYGAGATEESPVDVFHRPSKVPFGQATFIADHPFMVLNIMKTDIGLITLFRGRFTGVQ